MIMRQKIKNPTEETMKAEIENLSGTPSKAP